jgi:tRNA(Ile)-lysidine synthase
VNLDTDLMRLAHFPERATHVALAVSGGPDSLGLLLLALEAGLVVTVHHVDHHARATSTGEAAHVARICEQLGVTFVGHDVEVEPGANFEARARAARRAAMPSSVLTGHTMDDLAETVLLNMMRGAGIDGLSPMVHDATKPLRDIRRNDLHFYVARSAFIPTEDESNDNDVYSRNRVRHELMAVLSDIAGRDIVPLLARQASVIFDERAWLDALCEPDQLFELKDVDCRELRQWPLARQRRWLRAKLHVDDPDGVHPPSFEEVERALRVVNGEVVATELSGGRRLSRRGQRLTLD